MHSTAIFTLILLILVMAPTTLTHKIDTSIFDLFSWDIEDSDVEKKDDESGGTENRTCTCNGPSCMCCVDFNIRFIDLGGPGCVHMKYISQEDGIAVNVSYGENLLHSEQVKGRNPKPTCMSVLANLAEVCARFSNLHPVANGLKGCLQMEPKLLRQVQTQFDIGCFTIGSDGMTLDPTNSTITGIIQSKNETQSESEEFNEEELMAVVNETAEQGLVFFGNWLGLFEKPDVNATNSETGSETNTNSTARTSKPATT